MDERTKTALEGSIAKWQAIVDGTGFDRGPDNCPLCIAFFDTQGENDDGYTVSECNDCPVYQYTGETGCQRTPYMKASQSIGKQLADTPEKVAAARAELEFLEDLRDTNE
jgi:hypothetical protein